ncbi:YraN family protein [Natronospira bacteriovora]|uniref:UPF0102 protein RBH19_06515 n=1 Tax=Natronospira bacteriovora TaxID=3069753 RepID=A0ABU0W6G2_9GAMM|nr:YraN family protein [Natronospira sp. AB-CW4]MDQ2069518.1 YraN family protein [Natronospira sp. AB-CW4]
MSRSRGQGAESRAEAWLSRRGLRPLKRNVHLAGGELDLVMQDGDCVVFVEVRHRSQEDYGDALESISPSKRRHLIRAAEAFMAGLEEEQDGRFDVVAINGSLEDGEVEWVADAFGLDD